MVNKSQFIEEHRAIAKAVLAGDEVAAFALRDFLNEMDVRPLACKKSPPATKYAYCEACEEHFGKQQRKYTDSPLHVEYGDLADLDATLTLLCWWCFGAEEPPRRRMIYETYTVAEALMEAGIMRPSEPTVYDRLTIRVWRWEDAPMLLRYLSKHGGDEDWLALLPPEADVPPWMESGTPFGFCDMQMVNLGGWTVAIGAHA